MTRTIAALFVDPLGVYSRFCGVDLWGETRDARTYAGRDPVVAHPPCAPWCRLAGFRESKYGLKRGEDGGTFQAALDAVRRCGGILEHPAHSAAWKAHDLIPPGRGGWSVADFMGGWACHVSQGNYGHPAKKSTWLYAHSVDLPSLNWKEASPGHRWHTHLAAVDPVHRAQDDRPYLKHADRKATPIDFAALLLDIARTSRASSCSS